MRAPRSDAGTAYCPMAFLSWSLVVEIEGHWPWKR
jgi:hypothetical protein